MHMPEKQGSRTLGERERAVLRAVVENHISNPSPVASRTLSRTVLAPLGLSPATIRNIMADLDEMGYITQPHTSAGRVPTDKGYRFYIGELMPARPLSARQKQGIDRQLESARDGSEGIPFAASRLLVTYAQQAGLVLLPALSAEAVLRFHFVLIAARRVQVVLVGALGRVQNVLITLDEDLTEGDLEELANFLNRHHGGKTLKQIRVALRRQAGADEARAERLRQRALKIQEQVAIQGHDAELAVEGAAALVDLPEFRNNTQKLKNVLKLLADRKKLLTILDRCMDVNGGRLVVEIGAEFEHDGGIGECALIARGYGGEGTEGAVGIIGPTRMDYPRVMGVLDHFSRSLAGIMKGTR